MIFHQQLLHPESAPRIPWFAVHDALLGICLCEQLGNIITITPIIQDRGKTAVSSLSVVQSTYTMDDVGAEVCAHFHRKTDFIARGIRLVLNPPSALPTPDYPLPDYLLLNSLDGTTPAVMRTADPVFIAFANPKTGLLNTPLHYRSSIDLSAEGWAYWWEDAQRAFEKLTVAFCQEAGIPVPPHIAEAVRHH